MAEPQSTAEYRGVPEFPNYRVGSDGTLWSNYRRGTRGALASSWRRLKPITAQGYHFYSLYRDRKVFGVHVHTLVLLAFVGPRPDGYEACHNDGNRDNNCLANLRWDTRKANQADALKHGARLLGEAHHNAKLTAAQVKEARQRFAAGESNNVLAADYGVARRHMRRVLRRERWAHI